jgi:hypothetical protein
MESAHCYPCKENIVADTQSIVGYNNAGMTIPVLRNRCAGLSARPWSVEWCFAAPCLQCDGTYQRVPAVLSQDGNSLIDSWVE